MSATHDFPPAPGTVLAGKYTVVGVIGTGGMGVVVEAHHARLDRAVAVKLLQPAHRTVAEVTSRFEREARAAAALEGPHVARVLDVDSLPDGSPFMVMELLRGHNLDDELHRRGGRLPVRDAVGFVLQACSAMDEAHRLGIVHRDLKPSNLFIATHDGRQVLKVLDFGISKVTGDINLAMTTTQSAFGTPLYMSPEQVRSVKNVDHRTDIWSLGVILYELLTGNTPFAQPSSTAIFVSIAIDEPVPIHQVRPEVPPLLAAAVMRALAKEPGERFADVRAFASAIARFGPQELADGDTGFTASALEPIVDDASTATTSVLATTGASRPRSRLAIVLVAAGLTLAALLSLGVRELVAAGSRPSATAADDRPPTDPPSPAPAVTTSPTASSSVGTPHTPGVPSPSASSAEPTVVPETAEPPAASAPTARVRAPTPRPQVSGTAGAKPPPPRPPPEDPKYL